MGGDRGAAVVVAACKRIAARYPRVKLILVGQQRALEPLVADAGEQLSVLHASEVVAMDESPADAVRRKKDSSMRVAINLVKSGDAAACVSSGNTGALMATAKFVLKTLPGIDRPAIMAELPSTQGRVYLLDVGANSRCDAQQLFQFAVVGSAVVANLQDIAAPRIGLLNIGSEAEKGNDVTREASALLTQSGLNYVGFVEGNDIARHAADVIVTDGFTGNVALKTMEGTASLIAGFLRQSFRHSFAATLQALIARPSLRRLQRQLDPRAYNGASFVGLNGIVVKSHGSADDVAFEHAIETALFEIQDNLPAQIHRWLKSEAA